MSQYGRRFYEGQRDGSLIAARKIVPIVLGLVPARSVCDLGCGVGTWLDAFAENGVEDILGIDGDYVERGLLKIPADRFMPRDLAQPLALARRFDLAMSLEVAEHIPRSRARDFVDSLVALAPVVLFSAAIPRQGGVGHVNEQWQEYWAEIFAHRGYAWVDCIRGRIWHDESIPRWYRQNMLLFASEAAIAENPALATERERSRNCVLSLVHPESYRPLRPPPPDQLGLLQVVSLLPPAFYRAVRNRSARLLRR
jgi:SAM-dependent methyltransferase